MLIGNPGKVALRRLALVENRLLFRGKRRRLRELGDGDRLPLTVHKRIVSGHFGIDRAPRVDLSAAVQELLRDRSVHVHAALGCGCLVWIGGGRRFLAHKIPHA